MSLFLNPALVKPFAALARVSGMKRPFAIKRPSGSSTRAARLRLALIAFFVLPAMMAPLGSASASETAHKIVFHINEDDERLFKAALRNIENVARAYDEAGEQVIFEVVAHGRGIRMLLAEESPVADQISYLHLALENVTFTACGNTLDARTPKGGTRPALLDDVTVTQAGIVRVTQLQQQGYAYIKP